jgi:hypothetical protein
VVTFKDAVMITLSLLILVVALVLAIVALIQSRGAGLLSWAVLLTDVYLLLGHGLTL